MDVEFGGDVLAVQDDRVHGDTQHIRDFFVAQAAYDLNLYRVLTIIHC